MHEFELSPLEAGRVTALPQYYPTFLIDESDGRKRSARKPTSLKLVGVDCIFSSSQDSVLLRRAGHGVGLDVCQDYAGLSIGADGKRRIAVMADGVSCAVASQSVANIVTHKAMELLRELGENILDEKTALRVIETVHLDLAARFDRKLLMPELEEGYAQHFAADECREAVRRGGYGASTLSFMVLNGDRVDACMFGSEVFLIFRNNELIVRHANKAKCPSQLAAANSFDPKEIVLRSANVQKGDVVVLGTDGFLRRGVVDDAEALIAIIDQKIKDGYTLSQALYEVFLNFPSRDDRTMIVLYV
ncbi:protein phosphatase 2C domain-containing protein [Candidatus Peregrinibacteria bacterium]|nr:protein phosphatase 2C domain-containing protein [Candidatus Peregrinibacteria bacterium]